MLYVFSALYHMHAHAYTMSMSHIQKRIVIWTSCLYLLFSKQYMKHSFYQIQGRAKSNEFRNVVLTNIFFHFKLAFVLRFIETFRSRLPI